MFRICNVVCFRRFRVGWDDFRQGYHHCNGRIPVHIRKHVPAFTLINISCIRSSFSFKFYLWNILELQILSF